MSNLEKAILRVCFVLTAVCGLASLVVAAVDVMNPVGMGLLGVACFSAVVAIVVVGWRSIWNVQ